MNAIHVHQCPECGAKLSAWERTGCACQGPQTRINRDLLYAVACSAREAMHIRDFIRDVERDFNGFMNPATAVMTLSSDRRFCWAGRGLYGLYRHGLLPGARNLEDVTRIALVATGGPLSPEVLDFCLKQLGYRYSFASLRNAVLRSTNIGVRNNGSWDHPRGEDAERELRSSLSIVPRRKREAWIALRDETAQRIQTAITNREERLLSNTRMDIYGINWEE